MNRYFAAAGLKNLSFLLLTMCLAISCENSRRHVDFPENSPIVKDGATMLMTFIERDISAKGPVAWLDYFENAPGFFMATDGNLAFKNYPSAKTFILDTLVKNITKINLRWANLKVDPLATDLASVGANFHEELTGRNGKTNSVDGYFTGTAAFTKKGWKLKNLHWSIKHS